MMVRELTPSAHYRERFSPRTLAKLSTMSGVYVLSTFFQDILYIGSSRNLKQRVAQHLESTKYEHKSPKGRIYWFDYSFCQTTKCFYMERGWLNHFLGFYDRNFPLHYIVQDQKALFQSY